MALIVTVLMVAICMLCAGVDVANAQGAFGVGRAAHFAPHDQSGVFGWVLAKQAAYYRDFSGMIRAAKANGTAVYGLLGLSFTNGETWRRGIALSFASAFLQALAAVAIVGIFAALLSGTAATMTQAARAIEIASYCLIIAVGLRLCWMKGRNFLTELHGFGAARQRPLDHHSGHADSIAACTHDHDHHHHAHEHQHGTSCECGHAHGPQPQMLSGPGG
jgi:nickel/cobalt exporter